MLEEGCEISAGRAPLVLAPASSFRPAEGIAGQVAAKSSEMKKEIQERCRLNHLRFQRVIHQVVSHVRLRAATRDDDEDDYTR